MRIRIAMLAVLLTYSLTGYAQSKRSNELFAQGVELYQAGKYREAIPVFEECDRLDKAEMDSLDERRFLCEQWIASCYYKAGNIQEAKNQSFFTYELPPVDRRLTIQSDTLSSKIESLINLDRLEEALALSLLVSDLEEKALGGESWYSLNTKASQSYILGFLGRFAEAEKKIETVLDTFDKKYGNDCRLRAIYLRDAKDIYKLSGNIIKLDACYQQLFSFLTKIGEHNSDFAEDLLVDASGVYAQIGNHQRLDEIVEMQMQQVIAKYGEKSIRRCNLFRSASQLNAKLGRLNIALQMANDGLQLVKEVDDPLDETRLVLLAARAMTLMNMKRFKEARADLRSCLKGAKRINNPEVTVDILSATMLLESAEGKKMDEDMLADAMRLLDSMEITEANRLSYSSSTMLISQSLAVNGRTHEAAVIVNKNIPIYEQLNQFSPLFSACLIFLFDKQYVNARKASSKGLEILNKELQRDYVQVAVNENKGLINNGLQIVRNLEGQENSFRSDTTTYALSMIKQDLLQAKLYILYHTDSLGTEGFMNTLYQYVYTANSKTKDMVMADSLLNYFSRKVSKIYGNHSPQYLQIEDIRNRSLFDRSPDGRTDAYALNAYDEGDEMYDYWKKKYAADYAAWKVNRDKDPNEGLLTSKNYIIYEPPYLWKLNQDNYQIVADSCLLALQNIERLIPTAKFASDHHPYSYIRRLIKTWCLCSDSLGRQKDVVSLIGKWYNLLEEFKLKSDNQLLTTLSWAWMFGSENEYTELEQKLATNVKDDKNVLHAAVLFEVMREISQMYTGNTGKTLGQRAVKELDKTIQQIAASEQSLDLLSKKMFILRCMYMWEDYWDYGINHREDLLPDFLKIYELLEQQPGLQGYQDAYDAMNMLCDMTTDYSSNDYALTVKADKLRKTIKKACIKAQQEKTRQLGFSVSWPTFSPIGESFSLYAGVSYWEKKMEQLEQRILYAYSHEKENANGNAAEQYEDLMATWNEIRDKQKNSFSDSKDLMAKIEKLTTQVCRYLNDANVSDTIRRLAYDIALFGKGYLLRSEQQQRKVILQSGNRTVLQKYDEYLKLQQQLGNSALTDNEINELTSQANGIWSDLRYASKSFDDYTKSMEASWEEVRNALADDEVAIEYLRSGDILKNYYALILRREYDAPLVKDVGWEGRYTENPDTLYTVKERWRSPWPSYIYKKDKTYIQPLKDAKRIFVSPTGILHQIAMESFRDYYTDSIMSDKYQIYRVSSTRELIGRKHEKSQPKATLYGGINYQLSTDEWEMLAQSKGAVDKPLLAMRDVPLLSRGAVESALKPLTGTVQEVKDIAEVFSRQNNSADCIMGNQATEEHLKALSGSDVNVLHIATHGFYQSEEAAKDSTVVTFAREKRSAEANALSRSGLFMSGASAVFDDTPIPFNVDDGILTALEISHLDMTNINLVVLSACETGLGDITGDGVFGLQRGFKKAGAQSILMSLWKVDDEATCLLMTEFYKHWIGEKMSKHDALEAAKQTVRSHKERGWDDPKYWAAFILLDGLD